MVQNKTSWMFVALALALLLACSSRETEAACSLTQTFGSNSGEIDSSGEDSGFDVASGGVTTCRLSASPGSNCRVQLRYGGIPSSLMNDASNSSSECPITASAFANDNHGSLGWRVQASNYANLTLKCTCTQTGQTGGCFSDTTVVQVQDRGDVFMKDLQIGDKVLTGKNQYQTVYSFGHHNTGLEETFYQIHTNESKDPLEMTGIHLIFVLDEKGRQKAIRADNVTVGDQLVPSVPSTSPVRVTKISTTQKRGLYMPLTPDGTIVVAGFVASTYVSIRENAPTVVDSTRFFSLSEQTLSHWWMSHYRMLCMGVSANLCNRASHRNDSGILKWLLVGRRLAELAEPFGFFVRVVVMGVPAFVFFAGVNLVENLMRGPSMAPLLGMVLVGALMYFNRYRNNQGRNKKKNNNNIKGGKKFA